MRRENKKALDTRMQHIKDKAVLHVQELKVAIDQAARQKWSERKLQTRRKVILISLRSL